MPGIDDRPYDYSYSDRLYEQNRERQLDDARLLEQDRQRTALDAQERDRQRTADQLQDRLREDRMYARDGGGHDAGREAERLRRERQRVEREAAASQRARHADFGTFRPEPPRRAASDDSQFADLRARAAALSPADRAALGSAMLRQIGLPPESTAKAPASIQASASDTVSALGQLLGTIRGRSETTTQSAAPSSPELSPQAADLLGALGLSRPFPPTTNDPLQTTVMPDRKVVNEAIDYANRAGLDEMAAAEHAAEVGSLVASMQGHAPSCAAELLNHYRENIGAGATPAQALQSARETVQRQYERLTRALTNPSSQNAEALAELLRRIR